MKENLKGSLATANCDIYRYNWFILEKFDDNHEEDSVDCVDSGLPLNVEHKWDLVATATAATFNH